MAPDSSKSTRDPASDWVINIGPGAGDEGGGIVAEGPPAQVAKSAKSRTAPYLAQVLDEGGLGRPILFKVRLLTRHRIVARAAEP